MMAKPSIKICPSCDLYMIKNEVNSIPEKFEAYQHIEFDNNLICPKCMEKEGQRHKLEYVSNIPKDADKFNPLNSIESTIKTMSGVNTRTI